MFFDFDSFDIHPDFREMLEGHADERGSAEYNLALGQKRAAAVVWALLLLGAQESQLEAWEKNRRAALRPL